MYRSLTIPLVLILTCPASAWNKPGHMVSAAIAYNILAKDHPQTLAKVLETIRQHPDAKTFDNRVQAVPAEDRDRYVMMIAARWPDDVRGGRGSNGDKGNSHPTWHYIDQAYIPDADAGKVTAPAVNPTNAVSELKANLAVLKDPAANPSDKAIALCWVEHLTGDIHQPLHAVSLYSSQHPHGDRGGNYDFVRVHPESGVINLHSLWDGLITGSDRYTTCANIATELLNRPAFAAGALPESADLNSDDWAKESFEQAKSVAYRNGEIQGGQAVKTQKFYPMITRLSPRRLRRSG